MGEFFLTGSNSLLALNSNHNGWLVSLSVLVATLASYTALDLSGRVTATAGRLRQFWLLGGAIAMGLGIWSMHFIGMLAFSLPVDIRYDVGIVGISLLVAILASALALVLVSREIVTLAQLLGGSLLMGLGIAGMHYIGMAAMQMGPVEAVRYDPTLFFASVLIAAGASFAALWIAFQLRGQFSRRGVLLKSGAAVIMGIAIAGMHFTGMAAARFLVSSTVLANQEPVGDNFLASLAIAIGVATLVILGFVLITSFVDRRLATQMEQSNQEARQSRDFLEQRVLELLMQVQPVSQGDLTIRATVTEDQVGTIADSYNATIFNLRRLVTQVQESAQKVGQSTSASDASIKRLAQGSVAEAKMIRGALERLRQIEESIQSVATNARQATRIVEQTELAISAGEIAVDQTVEGFATIREAVSDSAKRVKRLGDSSQKIARVVQLISGFANQTNLLAFNASIEASRAGEAGRGFAVVADEVRALAKQSATATSEIEALVAEIQSGTQDAILSMEAGTERVVKGTQLVETTRQSLEKIASAGSEVTRLVNQIAESADRQAQESSVMTKTMTDINVVSSRTSAEASKVLESIRELQTVAETLLQSVERFKVN